MSLPSTESTTYKFTIPGEAPECYGGRRDLPVEVRRIEETGEMAIRLGGDMSRGVVVGVEQLDILCQKIASLA